MSDSENQQFNIKAAELTRLAAAQIRVAVTESSTNVDTLSTSFTEIVNQDKQIREHIQQLPDDEATKKLKDEISKLSTALRANIDEAVIAFQFYDRLCQRLDHTSECLRELSEIEDHQLESGTEKVAQLRENVYNHFTMIEERQLFDAVLGSSDFEQAIEQYDKARAESQKIDNKDEDFGDFELF